MCFFLQDFYLSLKLSRITHKASCLLFNVKAITVTSPKTPLQHDKAVLVLVVSRDTEKVFAGFILTAVIKEHAFYFVDNVKYMSKRTVYRILTV